MDEELTLTQAMEIDDDFDKFLLEEILLIVQNTDTLSLVSFWGHSKFNKDKVDEAFFQKVMLSVNALVKANALRRNYYKIKDNIIEEIKNSPDIKGARIDMLFNKVDAFILIEGFFSQIKTALDLLAQSLKPIYGIEFHTWAKKNDVSGQEIIDRLNNNLSKENKSHALPVIDLIEKSKSDITKIVKHRDDTIHYGKLNNVQGFRYSISRNEIIPPLILVTEKESEYVHKYLDEVLGYTSSFTQAFVITVLSNLINDMRVAKRPDGTWGWASTNLK